MMEREHEFQTPEVHEIPSNRERWTPDNFNDFNPPEASSNGNGAGHLAEAKGRIMSYMSQLAFHEYELSQAKARGFPEGQIIYHTKKIEYLLRIFNEGTLPQEQAQHYKNNGGD